jgi:hypothetical protein
MAELLKETRGASTTGNPGMPTDFPVSLERNTLKGGDKSRARWKTAAPAGDRRTAAADLRSMTFFIGVCAVPAVSATPSDWRAARK